MSQVISAPPQEDTKPSAPKSQSVSVGLILLAAHIPQLIRLGAIMWAKEHYQFFPLVLVGAVYLLWVRRDLYLERSQPNKIVAGCLWGITLIQFSGGVLLDSPWLVGSSAMWSLTSGAYSLGGGKWLLKSLPVLLFLGLAIPLPSEYDVKLITWLQRYVSVKASEILDWMGYRHMLDGVDLTFIQRAFKVDQACSGIHSFFAALCCTSFYLAASRRSFFRYLYMIPAAVFWVVVANILRILLVTLLSMEWHLPVDEGLGHELFGMLVFVFALGMIFSTDRLFVFVLPLRISEGAPPENVTANASFQKIFSRVPRFGFGAFAATLLLMICFAGLGGLSVVRADLLNRELDLVMDHKDFYRVPPQSMPAEWNGWILSDYREEKRDFSNPMGAYSQLWTYQRGGQVCLFSMDSPFPSWHDLAVCYQNIGWTLLDQTDVSYPEGSPVAGQRTELSLNRTDEGYQYVYFAAHDAEDRPVMVPQLYRVDMTRRFFDEIRSLKQIMGQQHQSATAPIYQMQLVTQTRSVHNEAQRQHTRELFNHLRVIATQTAERGNVPESTEE